MLKNEGVNILFFNLLTVCFMPFVGTVIGALSSFLGKGYSKRMNAVLSGFAGGVMMAACVWSLLIPSVEYASSYGKLSFLPACIGLVLGVIVMIYSDMFFSERTSETSARKTKLLFWAVTVHNIPEGMAVGAAFSTYMIHKTEDLLMGAMILSFGIAVQNIPEGAIVSLPFEKDGTSKVTSFLYGVLSGAVEPVAIFITIALSGVLVPMLPFALSFAAGAMMYVVIKELIPEYTGSEMEKIGIIAFVSGFSLMMSLDVAFG